VHHQDIGVHKESLPTPVSVEITQELGNPPLVCEMDPLSVTAALVQFLVFSGNCAKLFRKVIRDANHAPDEILALSNEISDLNILLSDLEASNRVIEQVRDSQSRPDISDAIGAQLLKARSILILLESLASELFTAPPGERPKFQRYKWLRKKSLVLDLQRDLANVKRSLALLLASITAYDALITFLFGANGWHCLSFAFAFFCIC
jgi:hypothetical protein